MTLSRTISPASLTNACLGKASATSPRVRKPHFRASFLTVFSNPPRDDARAVRHPELRHRAGDVLLHLVCADVKFASDHLVLVTVRTSFATSRSRAVNPMIGIRSSFPPDDDRRMTPAHTLCDRVRKSASVLR